MNTLINLAAMLAAFWASVYAFQDLAEPALGVVLVGVGAAFLMMAIVAVTDDWEILAGKDEPSEEE